VDVFDALTSKRPYKEPFSLETSVGIIREARGSHFDPAVADLFLEQAEALHAEICKADEPPYCTANWRSASRPTSISLYLQQRGRLQKNASMSDHDELKLLADKNKMKMGTHLLSSHIAIGHMAR